jgi:predicted metal-dependent hydrolase
MYRQESTKKKMCMKAGTTVEYEIRRHRRAKRMKLAVYNDGRVVLTLPWLARIKSAERFLEEKSQWVLDKLKELGAKNHRPFSASGTRKDYLLYKEQAREFVTRRLEHFNQFYGLKYNRVAVRNQKTCWGSCSEKKNLNFNYRIVQLPEEIADYVIVHELCHLKELNHSKQFWDLVAEQIPNYKKLREELHKY